MSNYTVTEITKEQEARFPEYVKKWSDVCTANNAQISYENIPVDEIVRDFRNLIQLPTEVPTIITNNPLEAWVMCCLVEQKVEIKDLANEMESVFNGNPKKYVIPAGSLPFQRNSLASVHSFYDVIFTEFGASRVNVSDELKTKYDVWERTTKNLYAVYPLQTVTIVSRHPKYIKLNENRVVHCDGGPAIEFDGFGDFKTYALNGIPVPEYLAVTPSHQIDIAKYNHETNADVKAEFIRKVGVERFLHMGIKLDTYENYDQETHTWWWKSEYELWDMKCLYPSLDTAPFLKMKNCTTGVWHVEGVDEKCKNLSDAIKDRFNGKDLKIVAVA